MLYLIINNRKTCCLLWDLSYPTPLPPFLSSPTRDQKMARSFFVDFTQVFGLVDVGSSTHLCGRLKNYINYFCIDFCFLFLSMFIFCEFNTGFCILLFLSMFIFCGFHTGFCIFLCCRLKNYINYFFINFHFHFYFFN